MKYFESVIPFILPIIILISLFFILSNRKPKDKKGNIANTYLFILIFSSIIITYPLITVFKVHIVFVVFAFLFNIIINYTAFRRLLKSLEKS